jgi:hypothetical protein
MTTKRVLSQLPKRRPYQIYLGQWTMSNIVFIQEYAHNYFSTLHLNCDT